MAGNTFGTVFRVTTWGESHGDAIGAVVDGCPSKLKIDRKFIQSELDRRRPGTSKIVTPRDEPDEVEILSGVFKGKATGAPISLLIKNRDADSSRYEELKNIFRPGHADFTYAAKYGIRDHRGGGRSSGRETAARVAAGAIAKLYLKSRGISVDGFTVELAGIRAKPSTSKAVPENILRCMDAAAAKRMEKAILKARAQGDSVGGIVEVIARGVPAGIGEPVFDKLDAMLAAALMSIGAVKAVEIGAGSDAAKMKGSEMNDPIAKRSGRIRFTKNDAGGILGGISTGEDIIARIAVKPTASISKPQKTVDADGKARTISIKGRHDPCIVPRIIPVAEAMVAITIADHLLRSGK